MPLDERPAYLDKVCTGDDPALRAEVESLLRSHEDAGSVFLKNPAVDLKNARPNPGRVGRKIGVYEIVEEIGHGGMGEVYRAVRADGQYDKQVAIKLVRVGFDTPMLLERFRHERQILASLDHPNIARLHDGGTTEDGIPYLVMELIEGERVDSYCDAHQLSIIQRLQLFRQIGSAVQYAHQRLVIHRDINPNNILVTKDGVPKLLDFGIAKLLAPSGHDETTLLHPMTPEYASPEQVRGETITTATDIYSLAVVLYRLLTGRSPYRLGNRSPARLSEAIASDEPERPSTSVRRRESVLRDGESHELTPENVSSTREATPLRLQQRLHGDLDFIVLKALRKEPAQRYSSVERFSDDIQRHLDGLPVTARRGTWSYRAGKFLKRHRVPVTAAALVFATLVIGIVTTVREARLAEANRRRAEARFNDVRKLANSLMFEVHDSIHDLPGATAARKLIIERAQEYLDVLSRDSQPDTSLLQELAAAYSRLASVQGNVVDANVGDSSSALQNQRKAVALLSVCLSREPSNALCLRQLAASQRDLSRALLITGDKQGSKDATRKAVAIIEPLAATHMGDEKIQSELADDYEALGNSLAEENDFSQALSFYGKAMDIHERLAAGAPTNSGYQQDLAFSHKHTASVLAVQNRYQEALDHYRAALGIDEKLLALDPQNARKQYNITYSYSDIGWVLGEQGEYDAALEFYGKALQIRQALATADPNDVHAHEGLGNTYAYMASNYERKGELVRALRFSRQSLAIRQSLLQKDPSSEYKLSKVADAQRLIGMSYSEMAGRARSRHSEQIRLCREANTWLEEALPVYQKLKSQGKLAGRDVSIPEEVTTQIEQCNRIIASGG